METQKPIKSDRPWLFGPGNKGKPPGTLNKLTRTVKEVVLDVFNKLQADEESPANLHNWALTEPSEFYKIAAKLIPTDIKAEVTQVREIALKVKRGAESITDIDHEIIANDQGSRIEPAVIPSGSGAGVPGAPTIQCSELWSEMGEVDPG